jgi:hypothetical protein
MGEVTVNFWNLWQRQARYAERRRRLPSDAASYLTCPRTIGGFFLLRPLAVRA